LLYDEHADLVDRILQATARRSGFGEADQEDFRSWALIKLLQDDCHRLSGFAGRAKFSTFLSVTVANLMKDYRNMRWGKWRPSAAARRLGEIAVHLETLVYRDRMSVEEAIDRTLSDFPGGGRRALIEILGKIPTRYRPFSVGSEALATVESPMRTDAEVLDHERSDLRDEVCGSLDDAMRSLSPEDALILKLRFWEGMKISEVAHVLKLPQKPLYRRVEQLLGTLRTSLEARGLSRSRVGELFL
jgi:RNA polymerase sigma factor (sigma-70 family)